MNKKFIRVLGLGVGLFLAGSLSVNAQKVSFNGERLSLKQAFEKIESVSKYKIAYNTSQLDVNKQVVLNQKNQDVLQILSDLLKGTNCVYSLISKLLFHLCKVNRITVNPRWCPCLKTIHLNSQFFETIT